VWTSRQLGEGRLSHGCKPHTPAFKSLAKHDIPESALADLPAFFRSFKAMPKVSQGIGLGYLDTLQVEVEVEVEVEGGVVSVVYTGAYSADFEAFWTIYPRKVAKGAAWRAWSAVKERPCLDTLTASVRSQAVSVQWTKDNGQFIPHPATWINQRRWEDDANGVQKGNPADAWREGTPPEGST
jgi:hypothetical protein